MTNTTPAPDHQGIEKTVIDSPPANLYQVEGIINDGIKGLENVNEDDIQFFRDHGYLIIHDAFTLSEVDKALHDLVELIAGNVPDFTGIHYEAKARDVLENIVGEARQDVVRKLAYFVNYAPDLKALSDHPKLLTALRKIIGEEPDMFQDMALIKPPRIGREKPWHQDFAYFNLPQGTQVVGVWIALDEATIDNGCMHIIPGTHLEGPHIHFQRRDWQICDTDVQINRCMAVPLKPGSCLFFDGLLHHGTPPSQSDKRRRAVQYHYKPSSINMFNDSTERLKIFGEDGKDVYC